MRSPHAPQNLSITSSRSSKCLENLCLHIKLPSQLQMLIDAEYLICKFICLFYLLKKFMCHHKSLNFVHTWKHIFTWEGVRLIWVWLNSPVYFIVSYKWNKVLEDQVTVWALHRELVDVSKMYLQCLSIGKLWTTRATLKSTFLWSQTSLHSINWWTNQAYYGIFSKLMSKNV